MTPKRSNVRSTRAPPLSTGRLLSALVPSDAPRAPRVAARADVVARAMRLIAEGRLIGSGPGSVAPGYSER